MRMPASLEQLAKLPKWASQEILDLRREVERANSRYLDTIDKRPSNVAIERLGTKGYEVSSYIHGATRVKYWPRQESDTILSSCELIASIFGEKKGSIQVSTNYGGLLVAPVSTNIVRVSVHGW